MKNKNLPCKICKEDTPFNIENTCIKCGNSGEVCVDYELLAYGISYSVYKDSQTFAKYIDENYENIQ